MYGDHTNRVPLFFFRDDEVGEDKAKSAELGYAVPKVVTMIYIVPHGHKGDPMTFVAEEYIERKKKEVSEGRYDPEWLKAYRHGYEEYRQGREVPRSGTPLIGYERILKNRRLELAKRYPTVEDLAAVPDHALGDIGLDGRVIRDLARGDIQAKKGMEPIVSELANANETIRRQEDMIKKLEERLTAVEAGERPSKKVRSE